MPPVEVELTGPVLTRLSNKADTTTGLFDAEIVEMTLSGEVPGVGPVVIRESPDLVSEGKTTIDTATSGGDGQFSVDSFFDVFTELLVDGGQSWIASEASTRVESVPHRLIPLVGPTEVHVFFEGGMEGDAQDNDNDGFDEVGTQLVSMDLRGRSPSGPVLFHNKQ